MPRPPLLILGASARAAAASAARAGFAPTAVDLFADRDLAALGPSHRIGPDDYPAGLAEVASRLPDAPWIYTGALENHPGLVDRIGRDRRLLGVGGEALRAVRDPSRWTGVLIAAGLPALPCLGPADAPPGSGAWLLKPRASAMGRGIRAWSIGERPIPGRSYLQAGARGVPLGACFVGIGGSARLVGVTRQLLGRSVEGPRVAYRGSVGPWPIGGRARRAIGRVGEALTGALGLAGLFGVDLVLDGETPWPVEINPRYTASVEVLEEALGVALLAEHARAFGEAGDGPAARGGRRQREESREKRAEGGGPGADVGGGSEDLPLRGGGPGSGADAGGPEPTRAVAKLILRARRPAVVPEGWPWSDAGPDVADIPGSGTVLAPGDPVLTVFGRGPDVGSATAHLKARAARWRRRIDGWPVPPTESS